MSIANRYANLLALKSEEVINQVLDEIGINLTSQLTDTPSSVGTATSTRANQKEAVEDDLQARLDNLKKG